MRLALFAASFALCVSSANAETIRFYHPDAQGNLMAMTDDHGHVVWRAEPAPFAKYTSHPPDHPQRFLDQPQEPNGLFEIGARWYDPDFGRFITPDPAPITTADLARPGALNRYAYGLNNPYRFHDSSGADPVETPPPDMMTQAARDFDPDLWKQALKFGIYRGVCLRLPGVCDVVEAVATAGEEVDIDILTAAAPGLSRAAGGVGGLAEFVRGGVYALRDAEGVVMRTGRTGDLARRAAEHARDPLLKDFAFDPIYKTDVYAERRGLEQILHDTHNPPLNKINPINPANPRFDEYMNAARDYLSRIGQ